MDFQTESAESRPAEQNAPPSELLTMVCHELRSPIASLRYAVRLYLGSDGQEVAKRQQLHALVERQTSRMTRLIDDLLDVSRMRNQSLQLRRERLDLRATVALAAETLACEIEARGHHLTSSVPDSPVWVTGDPFRLEQVFVNLLGNAAKYTAHEGQLSIRIHLREQQAFVRVCDSGIGIAPKLLPHIFELYRQADQTDAQPRAGLGIGLAIVRNLVEQHGGNVTATSRGAGQGSEFIVCLPTEN